MLRIPSSKKKQKLAEKETIYIKNYHPEE